MKKKPRDVVQAAAYQKHILNQIYYHSQQIEQNKKNIDSLIGSLKSSRVYDAYCDVCGTGYDDDHASRGWIYAMHCCKEFL